MTDIAVFHSVLGVRAGIDDAAGRLRSVGHDVLIVDQYEGQNFDSYEQANAYSESLGFPVLMRRALEAVEDLPDGFVALGFSNGAGMAEHVALHRAVSAAVLFSGALPLEMLGASKWSTGVPTQIHFAREDPVRRQEWLDSVVRSIQTAPATCEQYDYAGSGHLFTDPSLPAEYDKRAAEQAWERVISFLGDESRLQPTR